MNDAAWLLFALILAAIGLGILLGKRWDEPTPNPLDEPAEVPPQ